MIDYKSFVHGIRPFLYDNVYSNPELLGQLRSYIESKPEVLKTNISYSPFTIYIYFKDNVSDTTRLKYDIRNKLRDIIISLKDQVISECETILRRCSASNPDPYLLYQSIISNIDIICNLTVIALSESSILGVVVL